MVSPDAWRPIGVQDLERAAAEVVKGARSTLVIAGPGAGKTELLAQRACFLLQTGSCRDPRRILAVSFKKDAATNLRERVNKRAGTDLASRFDSVTFDSFAKSLLDRFGSMLPEDLRPTGDYQIDPISDKAFAGELNSLAGKHASLTQASLATISPGIMRKDVFEGPIAGWRSSSTCTVQQHAARLLWQKYLFASDRSLLTFPMIRRLVAFLLQQSESLKRLLRQTYPYVFLDEFQDTTGHQYEVLHTAFSDSGACLTAVGDHKQRIMVWAGAQKNVFEVFSETFHATEKPLLRNYRCAPNIIKLIDALAVHIDSSSPQAMPMRQVAGGGETELHIFTDEHAEATGLAEMIHGWINAGVAPGEIAVLTRNRAAEYTAPLASALSGYNIDCRDDGRSQDFFACPISLVVGHFLKLAMFSRAPDEWVFLEALLEQAYPAESDQKRLGRLKTGLRSVIEMLRSSAGAKEVLIQLYDFVTEWVGREFLRSTYPEYLKDGELERETAQGVEWLASIAESRSWREVVDYLYGNACIRCMTIHKSKGLEFDRVVFLGLEDSALWGFRGNPDEECCTFFVALSRAKNGVYFTFSRTRISGPSFRSQGPQSASDIRPLIDCLRSVGVREVAH